MIAPVEPAAADPDGLDSDDSRARLHRRLDELLDLQNEITRSIAINGMSEATGDLLQHRAEQLVIRTSRFAGEVAGGDARAIAFRHTEPESREAFVRFLNAVAEFAAPYSFSSLYQGIETFTWTDVMAVLDYLRSLEFGDTPAWLQPAKRQREKGDAYAVLCEKWRAVQWAAYLSGFVDQVHLKNKLMTDTAKFEVSQAYGVHEDTVRNWDRETRLIKDGPARLEALEEARREGELGLRPDFTRAPYRDESLATYKQWLAYDASIYKNLANSNSSKRRRASPRG